MGVSSFGPPHIKGRAKIDALLENGKPEDFRELGNMLYEVESRPLLTYIGRRLGVEISPEGSGLASDLLKLHSYHAAEGFLSSLAQQEYARFLLKEPPLLQGEHYRELRQHIAEVAVGVDYSFSERDLFRYPQGIENLTRFPLTILRRAAGSEVDPILIRAATRGGICPVMNQRALELLSYREDSSSKRVLDDQAIARLGRVLDDDLRDGFNRIVAASVIDRWLVKDGGYDSEGAQLLKTELLKHLPEGLETAESLAPNDVPRCLDTIRLLSRFDDPKVKDVIKLASRHSHPAVAIFARLCLSQGGDGCDERLSKVLDPATPGKLRTMALHIFGCRVSPEIDKDVLWPIFERHVRHAWGKHNSKDDFGLEERVGSLQVVVRRFFTEPVSSPLLSDVLKTVSSKNVAMASLALNSLTTIARNNWVPPLSFYDDPSTLSVVLGCLKILAKKEKSSGDEDSEIPALREQMDETFMFKGPSMYGFEVQLP